MSEQADMDGDGKTMLDDGVVKRLDKTFGIAAGVVLLVLMLVVTVDVIGRYLFSAPLRGAFEYVQICMALLVFMALPVVVAREDNVQVKVFEIFIPAALRRYTRLLGFAISVAVAGGLAWVSFLRASSFHASGERFVLLSAPLYPVAYFIFAMWVVCVAIMLVQVARHPSLARRREGGR